MFVFQWDLINCVELLLFEDSTFRAKKWLEAFTRICLPPVIGLLTIYAAQFAYYDGLRRGMKYEIQADGEKVYYNAIFGFREIDWNLKTGM